MCSARKVSCPFFLIIFCLCADCVVYGLFFLFCFCGAFFVFAVLVFVIVVFWFVKLGLISRCLWRLRMAFVCGTGDVCAWMGR